MDVILKRFEQPDEVRTFDKGKFEIVQIGGMTIGPRDLRTRVEMVAPCRVELLG
jgi:hypothetical protein